MRSQPGMQIERAKPQAAQTSTIAHVISPRITGLYFFFHGSHRTTTAHSRICGRRLGVRYL